VIHGEKETKAAKLTETSKEKTAYKDTMPDTGSEAVQAEDA